MKTMKRSCGVLLPIFSLPSPYGIGSLGRAAYDFIDFLAKAGQSWWQILPVGATSYGDSPYQSFSAYAGNPYFVDLDLLCEEGLLTRAEIREVDWGSDSARVDYEKIYRFRFDVLKKAMNRGWERDEKQVAAFGLENPWLSDYALFMALKRHFHMRPWTDWEEDIRLRRGDSVKRYEKLLREDVQLFTYIQYLFFRQWNCLRSYAREKGVSIMGDMPIYVALDSADVWADPQSFQLDENNLPKEVAGVPPDYFSVEGQLWGNPLYRWEAMKRDGYGWWIRRIGGAAKLYDALRIDHFRGLESYWAVPYGETTAKNGRWVKGPGMDLVGVLTSWFPQLQFVAEDLGILTPQVRRLLTDSGLPGMKVLEFAFDPQTPSDYLPHLYTENGVCYVGTHDNTPIAAWETEGAAEEVEFARRYLGLNEQEGFCWGILRGGLSSTAALFMAQMQDYLELGAEARINTPGTVAGNWQWRLQQEQLTEELAAKMAKAADMYGRSSARSK